MPAPIDPSDLPRPSLLGARRPSRLTHLAQQLESRHGPAQPGREDPLVERTAKKLAENGGDFSILDAREKRAALDLFWRRRGPWIAQPEHVGIWLAWAEAEWKPRIAEMRVCAALLRHFDPRHPTTALVCAWLAARQDKLWARFGDFARRWRLFDGASSAEQAGAILAGGDLSFVQEAERNAHAKILLQATGFLVAVLDSFARASSRRIDADAWSAAGSLLDLLGPRGFNGAGGPEFLRLDAKLATISGVVAWARARASAEARRRALDLCLRVGGDPRIDLADWRDVPEDLLAQIEKWLVEPTLAASFRIVAELRTDDAASLQKREDFWRAYLPHVTRARLIGARKAQQAATLLGEPCRALNTYLSDHCGFLLELQGEDGRRLQLLELNNLAQTLFWPENRAHAPGFDEKSYDGSLMRAKCAAFLSHLPPEAWPAKFAELIAEHTGIERD